MSPPSFSERMMSGPIQAGGKQLHFIVCRDELGHIVHYFLICTPQKLKMLKNCRYTQISLADYGVVAASGFGYEPTAATRRFLKSQYQYDYELVCKPAATEAEEE